MNKKSENGNKKYCFLFLLAIIISILFTGCSLLDNKTPSENEVINNEGHSVSSTQSVSDTAESVPVIISTSEAETDTIINQSETINTEPAPVSYRIELWIPPQFDTEKDTPAGKALASVISDYMQEHENVEIALRVKALTGDSNMVNTIIAADHVAKDVLPSLALMSRNDMELSVQRGMLNPINTSVFSDSGTWYDYSRQSALVENTVYGIPVAGDGWVLTYRGSKLGTALGDWQDILSRGMPIGFAPSSSTSVLGTYIYLTLGGKLTNEQGLPSLDQQKLIETLNFFQTGSQNGAFPASLSQIVDQSQVWQRFNDGAASMIISSFSNYRRFNSQEISVHPLPNLSGSKEYPLINTWNLVMFETNPILQVEALKFAEYLCDSVVNEKFTASSGYLPVRKNGHEAWMEDPDHDLVLMMSENGLLITNNIIAGKVVPIINNAVLQVIKNQALPEDAAKEAVAGLN